jgi:hypothetical protein
MEEILEYGNTSKKLKRKVGAHTHEWIVYVRPPKGGQFIYVDKVKFTFHDTCVKPVEICSQPPYQSVQTGWGNFTIQLQVFFKYGFKPWEGAHDLVIETDSEGMQRQPDGRIGTVPKRVVVVCAQLRPLVDTGVGWVVRRSSFPFRSPLTSAA